MKKCLPLLALLLILYKPQILVSQNTSYPYSHISLETLEDFANVTESWIKVKDVHFDLEEKGKMVIEEGTGVLLNTLGEKWISNLLTSFEHEDIEIEFDYMMAKGANAGIFLQGRYEIQMYDSWLKSNPQFSDNGGLYQRWNSNAESGKKGFHGQPPIVNVSKAPGLWQHMRIVFEAPRFDEDGEKIRNAIFREVYLNGVLVHNNIEATGPTRDAVFDTESRFGPIMFQGDHGVFAMKNIKYKLYESQNVELTDMILTSYDTIATLYDFEKRPVLYQKEIDLLDHSVPSKIDDFGGMVKGKIHVPEAGTYYFKLHLAWIPDDGPDGPNGGGQLIIDDSVVVAMDGTGTNGFGSIHLDAGSYDFNLKYYKSFRYGFAYKNDMLLGVEGPGIAYSDLHTPIVFNVDHSYNKHIVQTEGKITHQRGFYNDEGQIKTHTIAVGYPDEVSYAYDLEDAQLMSVWRGGFVNATGMWNDRGHSQTMIPNGSAIPLDLATRVVISTEDNSGNILSHISDPQYIGYELSSDNLPTYRYSFNEGELFDRIQMLEKNTGVWREISLDNASGQEKYKLVISTGKIIKELPNGMFAVGGKEYYLQFDEGDTPQLLEKSDGTVEVSITIPHSEEDTRRIGYSIIW